MKNPDAHEDLGFSEFQFLVFTIMGSKLGVDTAQIEQMLEPDRIGAQTDRVFRLHEIISFREKHIKYKAPKVLLIKGLTEQTGIVIDQPEAIIPIRINVIQSLPSFAMTTHRPAPIWGVTVKEDVIILLMDLYKLIGGIPNEL